MHRPQSSWVRLFSFSRPSRDVGPQGAFGELALQRCGAHRCGGGCAGSLKPRPTPEELLPSRLASQVQASRTWTVIWGDQPLPMSRRTDRSELEAEAQSPKESFGPRIGAIRAIRPLQTALVYR